MIAIQFPQINKITLASILTGVLSLTLANANSAFAAKTIDTISQASQMEPRSLASLPTSGANTLVMADDKGDRGMLTPYMHHKNGFGYLYTGYIFDTLLGQDKNGNSVPGLARSWELSKDGLVCDLMLNTDALWHDGKPVTAEDVAFTFSYMAQHPYAFVSLKSVDKVEAISNDHIRITLKHQDASFLSGKLVALPILPKHIYKKQPIPTRFAAKVAATGSGPYKLVDYNKTLGRYLFSKNPNHTPRKAKFERLAIVKASTEAALQAAKLGKIDVIARLPYDRIGEAKKVGLKVTTASSDLPVRLAYNHHKRFKNKDLRHALAYAIDRKAILDIVYHGGGLIAETGFFQKKSRWHAEQNDPSYAYNPEKAAELVQNLGWKRDADGKWVTHGQPVTFSLITGKEYKKLGKIIAEQLEAFGLTVDMRLLGRSAISSRIKTDNYDLALLSISTIGDPFNIARRVFGHSWKGDRFHGNSEMESVINRQQVTNDTKKREKLLHRFQKLYAEELPSYMLINPYWAIAYNDKVAPYFIPNGAAFGVPLAVHRYTFMQ